MLGTGDEMAQASPNPEKLQLLIVDDDVMLRTSLAAIFTQFGYSVRTADDGFAALAEMRHRRPSLLLSDLYMPGMSGFELLSVVRRRFPGIHVIAMSSAYRGKAIPDGVAADAYYEKAGNIGALLELVETAARQERDSANEAIRDTGREFVRNFVRNATGTPPMWVAKNGHDPRGEAFVTLTCPECLRNFDHVLDETSRQILHAGCRHCETKLDFAIVHALEPRFVPE
jgi:CheY-like chemotaxis protein